jgi:hypothetical protein
MPGNKWRYKTLQKEVNKLEFRKQQSHIALAQFNNQIQMQSKSLNSYRIHSEKEKIRIEHLHN